MDKGEEGCPGPTRGAFESTYVHTYVQVQVSGGGNKTVPLLCLACYTAARLNSQPSHHATDRPYITCCYPADLAGHVPKYAVEEVEGVSRAGLNY